MDAVKQTGAQAVHPGYGFLSENMKFAALLEKNGVAFIGPGSHAVDAMGDKLHSKKIAEAAKVNLIPGDLSEVPNAEEALKRAKKLGFPVMVKAVAGGGGKGMRVVYNDAECIEGFNLSKSEALAAFGDDRMLVEKFIENPRHIEIQVLADSFGKTLYLCERECSVQRRNQKVIEEAPSPFLTPALRKQMGEQAVALAKAVGYKSAGTVEMLVDGKSGDFYFLEMNTRLQVEHPITECITGIDIVEQMIRVAAGQPLKMNQEDIVPNGWAMESRVYAEDPLKTFLPSIGRLQRYIEPPTEEQSLVRCDSGVREGGEISMYYDPLICKLITHAPSRHEAIESMKRALDRYVIRGLRHNVNFLRDVLENKKFNSGKYSTQFIPEEFPKGYHGHVYTEAELRDLISTVAVIFRRRYERNWEISDQLESAAQPNLAVAFFSLPDGRTFRVDYEHVDEFEASLRIDGGEAVQFQYSWDFHLPLFEASFDGRVVAVQPLSQITNGIKMIHIGSAVDVLCWTEETNALRRHFRPKAKVDTSSWVASPMPGTVVKVDCKVGDKVFAGQALLVLEAMKMQNVLRAPRDGVIKKLNVRQGSEVAVDEVLVSFE